MSIALLETEKTYNQQLKGNFTLTLLNPKTKLNKTELIKALTQLNLKPNSVQVINPYIKQKKKNLKRGGVKIINKVRPKRFVVTLPDGQKLEENKITELQNILASNFEKQINNKQT
jgi:ribosomal protein L23